MGIGYIILSNDTPFLGNQTLSPTLFDFRKLRPKNKRILCSELRENTSSYYKKDVNGLNAAPSSGNPSNVPQTQNDNFLTQLLGLICGQFCKDTPLAEIIPKPAQNTPLLTTFADLTRFGFSKDICRSMIAMMDTDRSGKLGYEEFKALWVALRNWKNVWTLYDTDKSGAFSGFELRDAMHSAGYRLNNRVLGILMHRYGSKNGEIQFDDFMMCAIKVKTMIDIFKAKDKAEINTATFSLEEWLENTLYT